MNSWLIATRPRTLPAALSPVIVGSALAIGSGVFHFLALAAALIVALLLQIAANFANDGFDHVRGADTSDRVGPVRVTQQGLLTFRQIMTATAVATGVATLVGSYLVYRGGWPVLVLGIGAIVAMLGYTGGPVPLGYHGFGEATVFLFFGLIGVAGTYYVQALELSIEVLLISIPVGALTAAILVVNNLRDISTDSRAGKRTLAVRFGPGASVVEYGMLVGIAYGTLPLLWLAGLFSWWWIVPCSSLPLALALIRGVRRDRGQLLNLRLAQTALLTLLFSSLLGLAVVL